MKDQMSGQLKIFIVSYTAGQRGHITLIYYSQVIIYIIPLNLNFFQYFWLILANIFLANFEILA